MKQKVYVNDSQILQKSIHYQAHKNPLTV